MSSWWNPSSRPKGRSVLDRMAQARRRQEAAHRRAWRDAKHARQREEWNRIPEAERRRRLTRAALAGFIEAAGDPSTSLHRDDGVRLSPVDPNRTPPPVSGGNHCVDATPNP